MINLRQTTALLISICLLLTGSSSAAAISYSTPTATLPAATATFTPSPTATATSTPLPTSTPTVTVTSAPTPVPSPTLTPTWLPVKAGKVTAPILLYHHISDANPDTRYYMTLAAFEQQMQALHDWGYTRQKRLFLLLNNVSSEPSANAAFGTLGELLN